MITMGDAPVGATSLCEVEWFKGLYRKVYGVLGAEGMLPDPCEVKVLPAEPAPPEAHSGTYGLCWRDRRLLWFRVQPPPPIHFAHELLHLIGDKELELEEMYAYNLSHLVVMLARDNIIPPANPVRLFKDVTVNMVVDAIRKAYNYQFKDLAEFFGFIGVVPPFLKMVPSINGIRFAVRKEYPERLIVIMAVSELIAGAEFDKYMYRAVLKLLKMIAERMK